MGKIIFLTSTINWIADEEGSSQYGIFDSSLATG